MTHSLRLWLYSVACTPLKLVPNHNQNEYKMLLFCLDADSNTHAIQVDQYWTSVAVEVNRIQLETFGRKNAIQFLLEDSILDKYIQRIEINEKTPLIGFSNSEKVPTLKLFLRNECHRKTVVSLLQRTNQIGSIDLEEILHSKISCETQFLYDSKLKLQSWFDVVVSNDPGMHNFFAQNVQCHTALFRNIVRVSKKLDIPAPRLRKLYLRSIAHSSTATQTNQFDPSYDIEEDRSTQIAFTTSDDAKQGDEEENKEVTILDISDFDNNEALFLQHFGDILESLNIHIIVFASDERVTPNSLVYLFQRASKYGVNLHFSKLTQLQLKCELRPCGENSIFLDFKHPGVERVDICRVLVKAMISPNLDGFRLLDALRHPKLIDKDVKEKYFSVLLHLNYHELTTFATKDSIHKDITLKVLLLKKLEQQNEFTASQLNISKICDTDLTSVVERGQQIRSIHNWSRMYHKHHIYINARQVKKQYCVVRKPRNESDYPDPPWLENPPLSNMRGEKPHQHIIRQNLPPHLTFLLQHEHNNIFDTSSPSPSTTTENNGNHTTQTKTTDMSSDQKTTRKKKIENDESESENEHCIFDAEEEEEEEPDHINTPIPIEPLDKNKEECKESASSTLGSKWWINRRSLDFVRKRKRQKVVLTQEEEDRKKRFRGGLVLKPESGFYTKPEETAASLDFGSLYPSIIEANKLCYMRVIYNPKWLEDPNLELEYVPITATECLVLAKAYKGVPVATITPQIIHKIVQMRKDIRAEQKKYDKSSFKFKVLESAQLAAKVVQNSSYGFIGAATSGMTCTALAAAVTQIGQWMNRNVRFVILFFGGFVYYGDTDSDICRFWVHSKYKTPDEIFQNVYEQAYTIRKIAESLFLAPNTLNLENFKLPYLQTDKKKTYAALEMSPEMGSWLLLKDRKEHISGVTAKKRDKCSYAQSIGMALLHKLLHTSDTLDDYCRWFESEINKIPQGPITTIEQLDSFIITCELNHTYKRKKGVLALALADMIAKETGARPQPGTRLAYVRAYFPQANTSMDAKKVSKRLHADNCETPDLFLQNKHLIDVKYYLENQIFKCVTQILCLPVHKQLHAALESILNRAVITWVHIRNRVRQMHVFLQKSERKVVHEQLSTLSVANVIHSPPPPPLAPAVPVTSSVLETTTTTTTTTSTSVFAPLIASVFPKKKKTAKRSKKRCTEDTNTTSTDAKNNDLSEEKCDKTKQNKKHKTKNITLSASQECKKQPSLNKSTSKSQSQNILSFFKPVNCK